jgi:hypothetical protein
MINWMGRLGKGWASACVTSRLNPHTIKSKAKATHDRFMVPSFTKLILF